tara:strand:+ start:1255 stop:1722 length:468 start_codon:yes stop_codon:yes gene_type:complete
MDKIIKKILIVLFVLTLGCGYKPIFKNDYVFSINELNLSGDGEVNSIISERFELLRTIRKELNYNLNVETDLIKKTISKNSKGDPLIFELLIETKIELIKDDKIVLTRKIVKKDNYNNISDKFELERFEKIVIKNLSSNISMDIITIISNFSDDS